MLSERFSAARFEIAIGIRICVSLVFNAAGQGAYAGISVA